MVGIGIDPNGPRPMTDEELLNSDLRRISGDAFDDATVDWTPTRELHARRPGRKVQGSEGVGRVRFAVRDPDVALHVNMVRVLRQTANGVGLRRRLIVFLTNQLGRAPVKAEILAEAHRRLALWLARKPSDPDPFPELRMRVVSVADIDQDDVQLENIDVPHTWSNEPK